MGYGDKYSLRRRLEEEHGWVRGACVYACMRVCVHAGGFGRTF